MKKFLVINGPNLNLLGQREPEVYGTETLADLQKYTVEKLKGKNIEVQWLQSNLEGDIVQYIQKTFTDIFHGIVINPGGYSHTSVAIYDALRIAQCPVIEVHLSNIYAREEFRQQVLTGRAAKAVLTGLGKDAYWLALMSLT